MTGPSITAARNIVPGKYRGVAVSTVDVPLDAASLTAHLLGRDAYRRTRFVVARSGQHDGRMALARVWRDVPAGTDTLFAPITRVEVLAEPDDCAWVEDPECDTANPSDLAHAARSHAPDTRAVIVQGRYEHVSFIIGADPLRVTVREVSPPDPPKLLDQARRVLALAEDLPPMELVPDIVQLADLAAQHPAESYLVPCRVSGFAPPGARTFYLDEHPPEPGPGHEWTLLGPERSQQIHEAFYGHAATLVDICPDNRPPVDGPLLTKCSLLENDLRVTDGQVTVPWGSSLAQVRQALGALAEYWEPAWQPV
jgi:hypothetical protein